MFNSLIHGDCIAGMKELPDGCINLAFADPPYNIGYEYDTYDDRKSCDEYLSWCRDWTDQIYRVLKPAGAFWLAIGDEYAAEMKVMLTRERTEPFYLRSWVIWYYTFGVNCKNKFSRSHAHLLYFVKDPGQFTFNADDPAVRVPTPDNSFTETSARTRREDFPMIPGLRHLQAGAMAPAWNRT